MGNSWLWQKCSDGTEDKTHLGLHSKDISAAFIVLGPDLGKYLVKKQGKSDNYFSTDPPKGKQ
jgi:hypothetical protein